MSRVHGGKEFGAFWLSNLTSGCTITNLSENKQAQARSQGGPGGPGPPRQSKALLTHCFGYTVGLTFQSPKIKLLPPDSRFFRL